MSQEYWTSHDFVSPIYQLVALNELHPVLKSNLDETMLGGHCRKISALRSVLISHNQCVVLTRSAPKEPQVQSCAIVSRSPVKFLWKYNHRQPRRARVAVLEADGSPGVANGPPPCNPTTNHHTTLLTGANVCTPPSCLQVCH